MALDRERNTSYDSRAKKSPRRPLMSTRSTTKFLVACFTLILSASFVAVPSHAQTALTFKTINAPGATETDCNDINTTNVIVGFFLDSAALGHGFSITAGVFKKIDVP